jgi:hypothetical protein
MGKVNPPLISFSAMARTSAAIVHALAVLDSAILGLRPPRLMLRGDFNRIKA